MSDERERARLHAMLASISQSERVRLLEFFAAQLEQHYGVSVPWRDDLRHLPGGGDDSRQAFGGERAYRAAAGE